MTKELPGGFHVCVHPNLVVLTGGRTLAGQAEVLVHHEFAEAGVAGSGDGEANDDG